MAFWGSIYQKQQDYDETVVNYTIPLNLVPEDIYTRTNRSEYILIGKINGSGP
jgi:hypothetical protein